MASLVLISMVLLPFLPISALDRTCTSRECEKENIICDSNQDCSIQCTGHSSCLGAVIDCATSPNITTCSLNCTGSLSCQGATVKCPADGICNVNCIGEDSYMCSDIEVTSNTNTTTNINCLGETACVAATISCSDSWECNLDCYGSSACGEPGSALRIFGNTTSLLNLTRCIGGTQVCEDMEVYCPSNVGGRPRCFLPGDGVFNERKALSGGQKEVVAGGLQIYAVQTWNDISIQQYASDNLLSGTMHCGPNHGINCSITNDMTSSQWDCNHNESLCSRITYQEPTTEPTSEPTTVPTVDPTINPTTNPTLEPTLDPTSDPTMIPTSEPTQPTKPPTGDPTTEPTMVPSDAPTESPVVRLGGDHDAKDVHFGFYVGGIIAVGFVFTIFCGYRWWKRGKEEVVVMLDKEILSDDTNQDEMQRKGKKKRKRKDSKTQSLNGDMNNGGDVMTNNADEDERNGGKEEVIEVMVGSGGNTKMASNGGEERKKKKKKKKKKKRRKQKEDKDGDYQKQMDDPFQTNDWTELTEFD